MGTVFDLFTSDNYEYLQVERGMVEGNRITKTIPHEGVFKLRSGMTQSARGSSMSADREVEQSDATLHVHPEDYDGISPDELVGNGIRYNGVNYRIAGVTEGKDFDTGEVEFYRLTLEKEQQTDEEDYI